MATTPLMMVEELNLLIDTPVDNPNANLLNLLDGGEYVTYSELQNSSEVIVVVHFIGDTNQVTKLFPQTIMGGIGYPMDIKISLKPPLESLGKPRVLLGLMYSNAQEIQVDSRHYKEAGSLEKCRGFLHVHFYEAKDLPQQKGKILESSAKCYLLPNNKKVKCKSVTKKGAQPVWNEQFLIVGVGYVEIKKQALEFCLVSNQKTNKLIGGFRLSLGYRQIMAAQEGKANAVISKLLLKPLASDESKQHKEKTNGTEVKSFARLAIAMDRKEKEQQKNGIHHAQINGNVKTVDCAIKSVHPEIDTSNAWKVSSMDELRALDRTTTVHGSHIGRDHGNGSVTKDTCVTSPLTSETSKENDSLPNVVQNVTKEQATVRDTSNSHKPKMENSKPNERSKVLVHNGSPGNAATLAHAKENSGKLWLQRNDESKHCRNSPSQKRKQEDINKDVKEDNNNKEIDKIKKSQSTADIPEDDKSSMSCSSALTQRWNSDRQIKKDEKKKAKKTQLEEILGAGLDEMTLDAVGLEMKQWENVVSRPKQWHYCWQILRKDMIPVHHCKT